MEKLLEVKDLHTYFYTDQGISCAVEGVSFDIRQPEMLALVGESGCGKTVTALSIMRLISSGAGEIVKGEINFRGANMLELPAAQMRSIRGEHIGMVFQEPMSSLNPLYTIGYQIQETLLAHPIRNIISNGTRKKLTKKAAREQTLELLKKVEMPSAKERYSDYPHQLSGGLRQRAMIAQGISCHPSLLIADEPTTALDVTIQAQILELFSCLKEMKKMSILLITHDLGVVAEVADRVCVMYAGKIVEEADVFTIFKGPMHPYTEGLLNSIPSRLKEKKRLLSIPGAVPHPACKPSGCPFHPRCYKADKHCQSKAPSLVEIEKDHKVSCWKAK